MDFEVTQLNPEREALDFSFPELPGDPEQSKQTQRWLWSWLESLLIGTTVPE